MVLANSLGSLLAEIQATGATCVDASVREQECIGLFHKGAQCYRIVIIDDRYYLAVFVPKELSQQWVERFGDEITVPPPPGGNPETTTFVLHIVKSQEVLIELINDLVAGDWIDKAH